MVLIGNPDDFAIWFDMVEPWSTATFKNGAFGYFMGGELLWSLKSTIGDDIATLEALSCLRGNAEDAQLFGLQAQEAYCDLYKRAYPAVELGINNDWKHLAMPMSLSDEGYQIFLVEHEDMAKLIYGRSGFPGDVSEVPLARHDFQRIVCAAIKGWRDLESNFQKHSF